MMTKKIMPPLNDLYMRWDENGGYWYSPNGKQITPQEMMAYAAQLEARVDRWIRIAHNIADRNGELEESLREEKSEVAQLEERVRVLEIACKSGEKNTILLIEYAEPVYAQYGHSLTAIAQALGGE